MTCAACESFTQNRITGDYNGNCRDCKARMIANSQPFYESRRDKNRTKAYMGQLEAVFGKDGIEAGHAEVKRVAGLICGEVV